MRHPWVCVVGGGCAGVWLGFSRPKSPHTHMHARTHTTTTPFAWPCQFSGKVWISMSMSCCKGSGFRARAGAGGGLGAAFARPARAGQRPPPPKKTCWDSQLNANLLGLPIEFKLKKDVLQWFVGAEGGGQQGWHPNSGSHTILGGCAQSSTGSSYQQSM